MSRLMLEKLSQMSLREIEGYGKGLSTFQDPHQKETLLLPDHPPKMASTVWASNGMPVTQVDFLHKQAEADYMGRIQARREWLAQRGGSRR